MRTTYKFKPTIPYSLHDMRINKIDIEEEKDNFVAMDLSVYYEGNIVYDTHF